MFIYPKYKKLKLGLLDHKNKPLFRTKIRNCYSLWLKN